MLDILALEPVLEEAVIGGDVIVPALPTLPGHGGFNAQHAALHLPGSEDATGAAGQMNLGVEQRKAAIDSTPRNGVSKARFQFAYPLESGGTKLGVVIHEANPA